MVESVFQPSQREVKGFPQTLTLTVHESGSKETRNSVLGCNDRDARYILSRFNSRGSARASRKEESDSSNFITNQLFVGSNIRQTVVHKVTSSSPDK